MLGYDSLTECLGKGRIDIDHGKFSNVLYVQGLAYNLLLMYQMTHTGYPKKVIFSPDEFEITEISSGKFIAKGVANHTSYPTQTPLLFLFMLMKQERFGHLNYKYLSDLSEK